MSNVTAFATVEVVLSGLWLVIGAFGRWEVGFLQSIRTFC